MSTIRCVIFSLLILLFASPASAAGQFSFGAEGFRDHYKEASAQMTDDTDYGGLTAAYTYTSGNNYFWGLDGRLDGGTDHYSSVANGTSSGSPQYEAEVRLRVGSTLGAAGGGTVSPYIGLGGRFFEDNSKNTVTSLGAAGYDRRIAQMYVPAGATWHLPMGRWIVSPAFEYDQLLKGWVNSRMQNAGGFNLSNTQSSGYGLRAELMFGEGAEGRHGWEIGPFVRYWNIQDSNVYTAPDTSRWVEPHNTRLQTGIAARLLF